ncbi:nucleotide-diphospho-sugar transferase [Hymenobacter elongatus]|uniref:nucleotide-diphospho-sugar transferase n=1 Tax=Hymenobacter elongatus TaxID=877208 RepID=UPI001AEBADA8|nr:nucleotide-diphospho-sugar transferase [Hymenobacter elongatus]
MPHPNASAPATPAVLLLLFNRADTTRAVFETIRQARPARLYLAADGPRPGHPTDAATCAAARAEVAHVDWPCQVHTLFQTRNLNCGVGPATAISWFFSHEEEGIILEDDCVAAPDFFRFCAELLARYRHDARVLHIGGNNFGSEARQPLLPGADSYYFSGQVNSWGWASWRRAWRLFDFELTHFETLRTQGVLRKHYGGWLEEQYWLRQFAAVRRAPAPPDVWDYQWHFAVAAHAGLTIVPAVNLVGNIGFGHYGTHTHDAADDFAAVPTAALPLPLQHPVAVQRDCPRDQRRFREFLAGRVAAKARRLLRRFRTPGLSAAPPPVPLPAPVPAPVRAATTADAFL